jgi:hypothetical protein
MLLYSSCIDQIKIINKPMITIEKTHITNSNILSYFEKYP